MQPFENQRLHPIASDNKLAALVAEEIYNDVRFLTEPDKSVWWYDGPLISSLSARQTRTDPSTWLPLMT